MKLMTKEIEKAFEKQGDTSEKDTKDISIITKYFNPTGRGTWYAVEYDPKTKIFFGFVSLFGDHNDELGSFCLDELEDFVGSLGLGIERDLYFGEHNLQEVIDGGRP